MESEQKNSKVNLEEAKEKIVLATCEGSWFTVGNTVYISNSIPDGILSRSEQRWLAFLGDIPRAKIIASLPELCSSLITRIEQLERDYRLAGKAYLDMYEGGFELDENLETLPIERITQREGQLINMICTEFPEFDACYEGDSVEN